MLRRQNKSSSQSRVPAIRKNEINDPEVRTERQQRLRPVSGQGSQLFSSHWNDKRQCSEYVFFIQLHKTLLISQRTGPQRKTPPTPRFDI
jgi:hypothetical protein